MIAHMSPLWMSMNDTQGFEQDIKNFLAKPIVLATGNFNITDTYTFLNSYAMPFNAFSAPEGSLWTEKLKGFFGIRMDMRFRLIVNANRFQQGRYMIGWMPTGGNTLTTSDLKGVITNNIHMATLVQRTTVPHVEFDLATQTSAELLVPFASVNNFYPLNAAIAATKAANLGYLNVYPYIPLVAPTGSTVASYTLYVSFENVRLFGAAAPQSGIQDKEVSNKMNGPISGIATSFAKGFTEFSNIPLLSSYAKGAAWIADRIAKTASIFGFSKPTQGDSISKLQILNNPGHCNVDGDSDVRTLAFLAKPSTVPIDGQSGSAFDEMDFSFVAKKYAWFRTVPWTTSSTGVLTSIPVVPSLAYGAGGATHFQPVCFVASMFQLWRGSLKFKFKIVKTEFHSGRLQFCFYPTDDILALTGSPQYVNRTIVDIRDNIEFEFIVPYIARDPYQYNNVATGSFRIEVVDALVAPSSVSSSISILCEVAAGDDFEVAVPAAFNYMPTIFTPQSGLAQNKVNSMLIGNSTITADSTAAAAFSIGDKVSNFRALLKRFNPVLPNSRLAVSTSRLTNLQIAIVPDFIPILEATPTTYYTQTDIVGTLALCYAFWGGSIRFKDVLAPSLTTTPSLVNSSTTVLITANTRTAVASEAKMLTQYATGTGAYSYNWHQIIQQTNLNNTVSFEVPQYTKTLKRCVADLWGSNPTVGASYLNYQTSGGTQLLVNLSLPAGLGTLAPIANYDTHNIYRSLGDDGDLSGFISIPPLVPVTTVGLYGFY